MKTNNYTKGVSVIVCCYNSVSRIKPTLEALAKQVFNTNLLWEIVLVDNASTDDTAAFARACWNQSGADVALRIVHEPLAGLGRARQRGIQEASYSCLLFCDDDNWLSPGYVQGIFNVLDGDHTIAACGGTGIPVFETTKPVWFDSYAEAFATGPQENNVENQRILNLYGAGLGINKSIYNELEKINFSPLLQGRTGNALSSSEDTELTYAFVLMGYKLQYIAKLQFYHYLPTGRLTYAYLKKLFTAFGNDGPVRNLYYAHISSRLFHKQIKNWWFHLILSIYRLMKYSVIPPKKNGRAIYFAWNMAYIKSLLSIKPAYKQMQSRISLLQKSSCTIQQTHVLLQSQDLKPDPVFQ